MKVKNGDLFKRRAIMTKLTTFEELITTRFSEIVSIAEKQTAFVLKGFTAPEIESICKTAEKLGCDVQVPDVSPLDISGIENGAREFLVSLMTPGDKPLVCLYEQYQSVCTTLSGGVKLTDRRFVIVDNNLFLSVSPALIPENTAKELAAYFDSESTEDPENLSIYTKYYSDADRFGVSGYGVRQINKHTDEKLQVIPFFQPLKSDVLPEEETGSELEAMSDEMWQYIMDIQNGTVPEPVTIICGENNSGDCSVAALAGVLSVLGVKFGVKKYNAFEEIITGTRSFLPLLRRMHGKNAEFRQLKFYKSPNFSNEVIEISQEAVISDIVNQSEKALSGDKTHRNFFITAPTGAGKSLLFQLPAIHLAEQYDAVTIVVSPLIALMKDQVEGLEERGVTCATFLNSTISYEEREKRSAQIKNGEKSIVYLAPELLLSCPLETLLGSRKPGLFVVDEAHTVTSWGRDFRVDYWFLGDYIKKARRSGFIFPVLCLTATAVYGGTEDVVNETIETLGLKHTRILLGSVRRENIDFDIRRFEKGATGSYEENKFKHSAKVIAEYVGESKKALIYCPYTTQVRELWNRVDSSCREKVGMYHGQLGTDLKNHYQEYFRNGKMSAMICTKAYGMGIDVKDITDCYHFAPSGNLADYIQEIGRIARDRNSQGTARIDFNPSDMRYTRVLHGISGLKQYQLKEMLRKLYDIYSVKNHRNMLVAPDVFGYLFDSDIENKVKNGLLLLSKDLEEKYGYPVIVVRPKTMFTKSFVCVAPDFEQKFITKYSSAVRKLRDDASETSVRKNAGNLYEVNMSYIWENEFSDLTFADFKRRFFEGELFSESGKKQFWPRMKLSIRYKKPFEQVFSTLSDFTGKMSEVLTQLQDNGFFGFDEFHKGMKEKLEGTETELNGEFLRIILDTFLVEPGERFVNAKKNPFKFIQKRANGVESKYRIINNNHLGLASRFLRLLSERKPNSGDDYVAYIPTADGSEKDKLMRLLNMLEILGLSSYEIRGGANVEVFVRINDPMKLKYLSTGKYTNLILRDIESKNNSATATLSSFFQADLTSEQRWNVVENYFLGNESAVKEALGVG